MSVVEKRVPFKPTDAQLLSCLCAAFTGSALVVGWTVQTSVEDRPSMTNKTVLLIASPPG